jgi:kynurenine formamidase
VACCGGQGTARHHEADPMKHIFALLALVLLLPTARAQDAFGRGKWLDLTHPFNAQSIYWPTATPFAKTTVFDGTTAGGYHYSAYEFHAAEHGGTHLDAPVHFAEGAHASDQVPLARLTGPGAVIHLGDRIGGDRDYRISAADILNWEATHGRLPAGAIVLFDTGSARFYGDKVRYMGTDQRGDAAVAKLHFPGLSAEAARLLVERGIAAAGLDTPSIDAGQSTDFMAHRILSANNIPAFENVANLADLPALGAFIIALPMKIEGGSGGPLRIVAYLPGD